MSFYLRIFFLVLFGISQMACIGPQHNLKKQTISGLEGQITELFGNAMPSKGKASSKGLPLTTKIYIYPPLYIQQLENQNGSFCTKINGVPLDSVVSDKVGHYYIVMKPGKYSIVAGYENGFFVPYFSGLNGVAYFNIEPHKTALLNITVNQKASY